MSTFVGFGFGAIQSGLFLPVAHESGSFNRLVVSEIDQETVSQIRKANGCYSFNIAEKDRLVSKTISGIEVFNPLVPEDRIELVKAIAEAQEMCTALPSFKLYDQGVSSVAKIISEGLKNKFESNDLPSAVIYAAENDARAAERLKNSCSLYISDIPDNRVVFSETVIAKMCSVVSDRDRIMNEDLVTLVDDFEKAVLVEAYDRIIIEDRVPINFNRGLKKFSTQSDLEPFALTKFLGHNAMHALMGLIAKEEGISFMHEVGNRTDLMQTVKSSFLEEAGVGLRYKYINVEDVLFSENGFFHYAEDALIRMVNPFLRDPVDRVTRDPVRKVGWNDRLIGSMKLSLRAGVEPKILAKGAFLGLKFACSENNWPSVNYAMGEIWKSVPFNEQDKIRELILASS